MQYTSMQHTNFALISTWVLLSQIVHCCFALFVSFNHHFFFRLLLHFGENCKQTTQTTDKPNVHCKVTPLLLERVDTTVS